MPAPPPLTLLHLDADLVAIDKPPGLLVHASRLDAHEPLDAHALLQAQLGERLWTLHRLDKGTSGVLLFARHVEAARALGAAFEAGAVKKSYLARVRGWPPEQGVIEQPLARDPERPSAGQPHLPACTHYRRLACGEWPIAHGGHANVRHALMLVEPLTGRRHQIRRHFKHIGHPLLGDSTHGKGPLNRAVAQWLGVQRLWLHAWHVQVPAVCGAAARAVHAPPGPQWGEPEPYFAALANSADWAFTTSHTTSA